MPRKIKFSQDDIVEAGLKVLQDAGWEGLTPKSVAKKLSASTMPIFSHFSSMDDLRRTLLDRAWEMVMDYVTRDYTGDSWVDIGVGYVFFARDYGRLFSCMHHGPLEDVLDRRYMFWKEISQRLENHPRFQGMDPVRAGWIRHIRALLTHGLAVSVSSGLTLIWKDEEVVEQMLALCSEVLFDGLSERGSRLDQILDRVSIEGKMRISGKAELNPSKNTSRKGDYSDQKG